MGSGRETGTEAEAGVGRGGRAERRAASEDRNRGRRSPIQFSPPDLNPICTIVQPSIDGGGAKIKEHQSVGSGESARRSLGGADCGGNCAARSVCAERGAVRFQHVAEGPSHHLTYTAHCRRGHWGVFTEVPVCIPCGHFSNHPKESCVICVLTSRHCFAFCWKSRKHFRTPRQWKTNIHKAESALVDPEEPPSKSCPLISCSMPNVPHSSKTFSRSEFAPLPKVCP